MNNEQEKTEVPQRHTRKENEEQLQAMFSECPQARQFLADIAGGDDPVAGLIRLLGVDGLKAYLEDPDMADRIAEKNQEHLDDLAQEAQVREMWTANVNASLDAEEEALRQGILDEDDMNKAHESLSRKVDNYVVGLWTIDDLQDELKALNYNDDMLRTAAEAELRGRNAQIMERKQQLRQGYGLPQSGGGGVSLRENPEKDCRNKLLALAKHRRSIWD